MHIEHCISNSSIISVVIPCRKGENAETTLNSLTEQTFQNFDIIIVIDTEGKGASWARNYGFKEVKTPYVLFSDNDIQWQKHALEHMLATLEDFPQAAYTYGWYEKGDRVFVGRVPFRAHSLAKENFVSTMSLLRTKDFPGFDESLKRLQDWDLWLTLLRQKKIGVYCDSKLFYTKDRMNGITRTESLIEATKYIKQKHNLVD